MPQRAPKLLFALSAALMATGCITTQTAVLPDAGELSRPGDVKIVDARPDADKQSSVGSLMVTSCKYANYKIGDARTVPERLALLQRDLSDRLGARAEGRTVTVSRYAIYLNRRAKLRGQVFGMHKGLVAATMQGASEGCSKEEAGEAWFSLDEPETPNSPIIILLEASLDGGAKQTVRTVYSPSIELSGGFGPAPEAKELFAAMRKATDALAAALAPAP